MKCGAGRAARALADAPVVFRGEFDDISVDANYDPIDLRHTVVRSVDFFDSETYYLDAAGAWQRYDVPEHVAVGGWEGWLMLEPRLDWSCGDALYPGGALLAIREREFLAGERRFVLALHAELADLGMRLDPHAPSSDRLVSGRCAEQDGAVAAAAV